MQEYDTMELEVPKQSYINEYSGVNKHLDLVLQHLDIFTSQNNF